MDGGLLLWVVLAASVATFIVSLLAFLARRGAGSSAVDRAVRDEFRLAREEQSAAFRALRDELATRAQTSADTSLRLIAEMCEAQDRRMATIQTALDETLRRAAQARDDFAAAAQKLREEIGASLRDGNDAALRSLGEITTMQQSQLGDVATRLKEMTDGSQASGERLREALALHLKELQGGNEKKLEEIRVTVDEKLHGTLEKRLGESFQLVSERLEAVQRGLGEMQTLASGVGDLKRALTNVKIRGVWGEYQLRSILEQMLTPDQYVPNYKPNDEGDEVVEFAIRLPGRQAGADPVYLPIDSKCPQEDYLRIVEAAERADPVALQEASAALERAVRGCARDISEKYLHPPATTNFGILFLPTEGLYAEVLRQPGLAEDLERKYRVTIAGPTTLSAILNSLRMGFHTLAIEQRSSEVWKVLGAVKSEFRKFGGVLEKVKKQLSTAANTIDATSQRTRAMERQLREVEELPADVVPTVLTLSPEQVGNLRAADDGDGDAEADAE